MTMTRSTSDPVQSGRRSMIGLIRQVFGQQREFCSRLSLARISTSCLPPLQGLFMHASFRGLRAARLPPAGFFGPFGAIRAANPGIAHCGALSGSWLLVSQIPPLFGGISRAQPLAGFRSLAMVQT
jgi:hypothetical protein